MKMLWVMLVGGMICCCGTATYGTQGGGTQGDGMQKDGTQRDGTQGDGTQRGGTQKEGTVRIGTVNYRPDGRDIVCHDGQNRYTRALYGGYTDFRVETSDRPIFATYRSRHCRNIRFFRFSVIRLLKISFSLFNFAN